MAGMYAQDTSVSVERSRAEIETVLGKYGASRDRGKPGDAQEAA